MSKFKVGDIVNYKFKGNGTGWNEYINGIITQTDLSTYIANYSYVNFPNVGIGAYYDSDLVLAEVKPKEELLLEKIEQLYSRQAWVKEGKQSALYYTKPPVQDAEKKDTISQETTLQYTQTAMNSAFDAICTSQSLREAWLALERFETRYYQRGWERQAGLAQSQENPGNGSQYPMEGHWREWFDDPITSR